MTTPNDVGQDQEARTYSSAPATRDEDHEPKTPFQEINERRSRVENVELLQHLRGL